MTSCPSCHTQWPTRMSDGSYRRLNVLTSAGLYVEGSLSNHPRVITSGKRTRVNHVFCAVCGDTSKVR